MNPIKTILTLCALCLGAALYAEVAAAASEWRILVVLSDTTAPYVELTQVLRASLEKRDLVKNFQTVQVGQLSELPARLPSDLWITVGVKAAEAVAGANVAVPTFNLLIPRQSFESLPRGAGKNLVSALYLDQPMVRQLQLIKAALPARDNVGVLLGPASQDRLRELQASARQSHMKLKVELVNAEEQLLPALKKVLADSDVLLAVPDPLVFNRDTAQNVLLTSYRAKAPLFAFSKSYVTAGALAAVYSTPAQIGQQAGEIIQRYLQVGGGTLPPSQYPEYFSVSVNYQVARSLGLVLDDEATLLERIKVSAERE